ncbi:hypothetical protein HPB48_010176 [Haemaphysalis longicornis]|uniref:THAP-type domain-containing protein n=1 Tax=Haemaphysalis longicornis TaxID=44386 RepID=A0A9J6FWA2_HAELO|nr:hypothetical protein HPB48_010176 [Haemaphysalis longicornis]
MRCCCVPFCTSSVRKKEPNVSYHEFPVDEALKTQWLKNISRKNWEPNSTSNYSVVCSLHFRPEDFRTDTKRRRLKQNAVPSVFPHYPKYMKPAPKRETRSDASIKKRKREPSPARTTSAAHKASSTLVLPAVTSRDAATVAACSTQGEVSEMEGIDVFGQRTSSSDCQDCETDMDEAETMAATPRPACALRTIGTQAEVRYTSAAYLERKKWTDKQRAWKARNERLQATVDAYKKELARLKEDNNVVKFLSIVNDAHQGNAKARLIMDQVVNYEAKKPAWSEITVRHCIILRNLSTKSYEYIRTENLLGLPCRTTLQKYLGSASGETGFSDLVKQRLNTELECLQTPQAKVCSLVVDEMRIKQRLEYHKQRDVFLGDVDVSKDLDHLLSASDKGELANSLLCFLLCGLHAKFKIPVGYFFTKGCTGELLAETIRHVIKKTEELGFQVVRLVTDNHRTNVAAMEILSGGQLQTQVTHPADPSRQLLLAFDQSHVIKNIRSQFLSKDFGQNQEISSTYVKDLYELQRGSSVKPVRFLTRRHLYPSNLEKMGVKTALQVFSPAVTAALSFMKDQAGHTCDAKFAGVGPTVEFMSNMHKWFVLMDVSNCQQHIHQNNPDTKEFSDPDDPRLQWLELVFIEYIENLKETSSEDSFLTKETYHALVFTTVSNVQCIRLLLSELRFQFVLTRKLSSDPIESFFGILRRCAGCNDMLDVRSTLCGIEKMLKTGIVASSKSSNVSSSTSFCSSRAIVGSNVHSTEITPSPTVKLAQQALRDVCTSATPFLPTADMAALSFVGGYIARAVAENIACDKCVALVQKPRGSCATDGLISHQDRGGLSYPTQQLVRLLHGLKKFVDAMLSDRRSLTKPLEACLTHSVEVITSMPVLVCANSDESHRRELVELICRKFIKPLLTNHAFDMTDKNAVRRMWCTKPLSRKVLKL